MNKNMANFNPAALPKEFISVAHSSDPKGAAKQFLLPGQMFASRQPMTVTTILGSCVAVCLWSPRTGIGGMNHYLLPEGAANETNWLRYGNNANPELLKQVLGLGCDVRDLQAKVFGGASTMAGIDPATSLGMRNLEMAVEFLRASRIPLMSKHVSEKRGCKLTFQTNNGVTVLKSFEDE
jgi:chemotaxis protein CheD